MSRKSHEQTPEKEVQKNSHNTDRHKDREGKDHPLQEENEMKKLLSALAIATMITTTALACPEWECNLDLNDYSCGGVHGCVTSSCSYTETYEYNEYSATCQAIYCQYCGHEQWDCICGTY